MDQLDYWRLCTDFTVVQAALIVCGAAPDELQYEVERNTSRRPEGYVPIRTAFENALYSQRMKPSKASFHWTEEGEQTNSFDLHTTTIAVEEIDRFLKSMGAVCDFFDRSGTSEAGDEATINLMPPKLRAALKAWSAVSADVDRLRGRSPKQALEQWLVENAAELGLVRRDDQPNRTAIEEISKVANWKPSGGAPATPVANPSSARPVMAGRPLIRLPVPQQGFSTGPRRLADFSTNLDDEIPF